MASPVRLFPSPASAAARPGPGDGARAPLQGPAATLAAAAQPFGTASDLDRVADWLGEASVVLLGESSHGTQEFYEARAELTRRLIAHQGFSAVAIEGDWPDAFQVNRYVRGRDGGTPGSALAGFRRFPTWMWRNTVVAEFVAWLRAWNAAQPPHHAAGFYGLDLYSLHTSMQAVVEYLAAHDPEAARAARASYACFDQYGDEADDYAWAAGRLVTGTCEEAVTRQLVALHRRRAELLRRGDEAASDDFFHAEQNARLARNAERYYRTMFHGRVSSWNIRDEHMAETLEELRAHLRARGRPPKVVVWAHNSHLGDARATQMGAGGELNVGQLARERYGREVRALGFTTYAGTVLAASDWGADPEVMPVTPALPDSYEELFHRVGRPRFFLPNPLATDAGRILSQARLERAIGVVYRPDAERVSHYFEAKLAAQFDGIIHLDETHALTPLESAQPALTGEAPETFPEGL